VKALVLRDGRPEFADLDRVPGSGQSSTEALPMRLIAAEVMPKDRQAAQGMVAMKLPEDLVLGSSAVAAGANQTYFVRGAIDAAGGLRDGVFAEEFLAEPGWLLPLPPGVDPLLAAAGTAVLMDAIYALDDLAALKPAETVLVLGASAGVGAAAVAVARHRGNPVVAVTRDPDQFVALDGVKVVAADTLPNSVREATGGVGAQVIVDTIGGEQTRAAILAGALRARQVVLGYLAGREPTGFTVTDLMIREHQLLGMNAHLVPPERQRTLAEEALQLLSEGAYSPAFRTVGMADGVAELLSTDPGHSRALIVP
jgi:NADPH2:quinone reductase